MMVPYPYGPLGGQPVVSCQWADKTKTLCTNPLCLERAKVDKHNGER